MYAYKPIERDEKAELNKIGSRVADFNNLDRPQRCSSPNGGARTLSGSHHRKDRQHAKSRKLFNSTHHAAAVLAISSAQ